MRPASESNGSRLRPYLAVLGCWIVWGLFNASRLRFVADLDWPTALRFGLPDALIWAALTPVPVYLVRRFPLVTGRVGRGIGVHLAAAVVLAVLHTLIDAGLSSLRSTEPAAWATLSTKIFRYTFHHNVMLYAVVVGIAYYLAHQRRIRERDLQAAELRARLSEARLIALRMQLRPHFLFNVLHTISGLMEADVARGRRVIRQLGELLRMSLVAEQVNEVSLERELRFVRLYLELEQARLGERLVVEIDAHPGTADCAVPVLVLQPLVENAVLHGVARRIAGGRIRITARIAGDRLELGVRDDGPGLESPSDRAGTGGIGIANIRARLAELYGERQELTVEELTGGGVRATVSIPCRRLSGPAETAVA